MHAILISTVKKNATFSTSSASRVDANNSNQGIECCLNGGMRDLEQNKLTVTSLPAIILT